MTATRTSTSRNGHISKAKQTAMTPLQAKRIRLESRIARLENRIAQLAEKKVEEKRRLVLIRKAQQRQILIDEDEDLPIRRSHMARRKYKRHDWLSFCERRCGGLHDGLSDATRVQLAIRGVHAADRRRDRDSHPRQYREARQVKLTDRDADFRATFRLTAGDKDILREHVLASGNPNEVAMSLNGECHGHY